MHSSKSSLAIQPSLSLSSYKKTLKISLLTIAVALFCGGSFFAYAKSSYDKALNDDFFTGTLKARDLTSEDERILDRMTFGMISCFVLSGIAGVAGVAVGSSSKSGKNDSTS
jgi:hypothetical protein